MYPIHAYGVADKQKMEIQTTINITMARQKYISAEKRMKDKALAI